MLNYIRRRKSGIVSWLIIGGVAIVFIFWGIGSRQDAAVRAATINGRDVLIDELDREAYLLEQRYRQAFGGQIPEGLLSRVNIRRQALDTLVVRTLLRQEAERLGIDVTDEEVREWVAAIPQFQEDGRFSTERYAELLAAGGFGDRLRTPAEFEAAVREQLTLEKVQRLARDAAAVSDAEARQAYRAEHDTVSLEVVRVPTRPDPGVPFPEDEVKAYYEAHEQEYTRPETVTVAAAVIDPGALTATADVSDEEVRAAYEARKDEFATPPEVSARHILVAVGEDADPAAVEAARAKARAALERLKKGEDFGKVALEVSDDRASLRDPKRAGDLGFFKRGEMHKAFEDAAFALEPGQLSDLVRTPFGFHVIRVDRVREEKAATLADVRDQLLGELKVGKARRQAAETAEALAGAAAERGDLATEATKAGIPVKTVGPIAPDRPAPELGTSGRVASEALRLQVGQVSPPVEDGGTWYVLQATARTEPSVAPLAEVANRVRAGIAREKAMAETKARAEKLLESARATGDLEGAAKAAGLTVETTGLFERRARRIPKIGAAPAVTEAAFRLTAASPFPDGPLPIGDDVLVIRLAERRAADPSADPEGLAQAAEALRREKGDEALQQMIEARRAAAEIWINPRLGLSTARSTE